MLAKVIQESGVRAAEHKFRISWIGAGRIDRTQQIAERDILIGRGNKIFQLDASVVVAARVI
jgi:hypothetical protein